MSGRVDLAEFLSAFVAEADEQLAVATTRLLAIEQAEKKGARDPRSLRDTFRALHTVKGLASMVGVDAIVALAHAMESVLRPADRAGGALPPGAVDPLIKGVRAIEIRVRALERGEMVAGAPDDLLGELDALIGGPGSNKDRGFRLTLEPSIAAKLAPFERELLTKPTGGRRAVQIEFAPSPERASRGLTINAVRDRIGAIAEIVRVLPISMAAGPRAPAGFVFVLLAVTASDNDALADACGVDLTSISSLGAENPPPASPQDVGAPSDVALAPAAEDTDFEALDIEPRRNVMRVNVARVDDAMDRLGGLLVTRARLASAIGRLAASGADTRELAGVAQENARQLRDLRSSILQVRMVPVIELLERLPLIVRALKRSSGKNVALIIEGGGAELDKAVADLVFPALVHLVRNAIDHGIEKSDERKRGGKPGEASLRVACVSRSSTGVVLSVEDDGQGIDAKAVFRRAGRAGDAAGATDTQLLDLICQPGLTTRDEATTTSGRGLGMDIVKRIVVDQLGGDLVLRSEPGRGTTFTLHIPLTVAIIDVFVIECGAQRFAVPVSTVEEVVEIDNAALVQPPRLPSFEGPQGVVRLVGVVPRRRETLSLYELIPLRRPPAVNPPSSPASTSTASGAGSASPSGGASSPALSSSPALPSHLPPPSHLAPPLKALVVRRRGEAIGLVVDRVVGQQEAVVRPLVDLLVRVPGVAGATELGDGRATLVIDIGGLAATARVGRGAGAPALSETSARRLPASGHAGQGAA